MTAAMFGEQMRQSKSCSVDSSHAVLRLLLGEEGNSQRVQVCMHCLVAHRAAACLVAQAGAPLLEQLQDLWWKRGQWQALLSLQDRQDQHEASRACAAC